MSEERIIAKNKKAYFLYEIVETFSAGIVLTGSEIKSIRAGKVNFVDAYAAIIKGELILKGLHIAPYDHGGYANHEPTRDRKLLLTKSEINRINRKVTEKGLTIVPLSCFINEKGYAKLEIAIVKGKKAYDKRESIKKKDNARDTERSMNDY
ncbi:MAG TPA: SsrA-binding protein SmpB [Bacteroidales bacterium]|nr:SsrA-binding protein SmpB [Bacteroidales bacterium]